MEPSQISRRFLRTALALALLVAGGHAAMTTPPEEKEAGEAMRHIVVRVPAANIGARTKDEMPAEYRLSAPDFIPDRRLDPSSLEVRRYDPGTGRDLSGPLPLRWCDDAIPYNFLECEQNIHATDGLKLTFVSRPRWGEFYNVLGDGIAGRLVWTHRQERMQPSFYTISFRLLAKGKVPERLPPRGFVGDGSHRCQPIGSSTTGMIHSRLTVADWNGDGLSDLLIGGARGQVLFYPNLGNRTKPEFRHARILLTDGKPLDVGWSAAPLAVDWDGDGITDVLCGAERNRILFFRNVGTNGSPKMVNKGFVKVDGQPLALPTEPVPKSSPGIYALDYYPVLEAVDWNGDGRIDLLAGGYVTGRVYFYENTGKNPDGTPRLKFRGPLLADGKPLRNVENNNFPIWGSYGKLS